MPQAAGAGTPRSQWAPDARALGIVGDRWVMVIVRDLAAGPLRRKTLGHLLPGLSAGALQERLAQMEDAGLIVRHRERALPPRVEVELTEQGRALAGVIAALARWELRARWSQPRADEWIDIGAWFRLAPLLFDPASWPAGVKGVLALEVLEPEGAGDLHATFVCGGEHARLEPREAPRPDARLSGREDAWVRALAPGGTIAELAVEGDERLAAAFLALFATELDRPDRGS